MTSIQQNPLEIKRSDGGPWSPAAVRRRALSDLAEIATAMHGRRRDTRDIELALLRQASLWRQQGAALPPDAVLITLRQLPGMSGYCPLAAWRDRWSGHDEAILAEGILADGTAEARDRRLRHRHLVAAAWLARHAGTGSAEAFVCAGERDLAEHLEGAA